MKKHVILSVALVFSCFVFLAGAAHAETVKAEVFTATPEGAGMSLGMISFTDTKDGLSIMVDLKGLPPGERGFHIHEFPNCGPKEQDGKMVPALAAGGHYDPQKTGKHLGPGKGGHFGDLPFLVVDAKGNAKTTIVLNGVKASDFKDRSIMVHGGGDNYSDTPVTLGGGGPRIACGVIK